MPVSSQEEKSTRGAVVVSDEQILTAFVDSGLSSHEVAHSLGVRVQRVQQVCTREFGADVFQAQESLAVKRQNSSCGNERVQSITDIVKPACNWAICCVFSGQ